MALAPANANTDFLPRGQTWIVSQVTRTASVYDGEGNILTYQGTPFQVHFDQPGPGTPMDAYRASYPGEAMPVSIAFNRGNEFLVPQANGGNAPAVFIVGALDGALHAWHPNTTATFPSTTGRLMVTAPQAAYTGITIAQIGASTPTLPPQQQPSTTTPDDATLLAQLWQLIVTALANIGIHVDPFFTPSAPVTPPQNTTQPPPTSVPAGSSQWRLYAADLGSGAVHIYDGNWQRLDTATTFRDPNVPAGYAAYNVWANEGTVYVSYTIRDPFSGTVCRCSLRFVC